MFQCLRCRKKVSDWTARKRESDNRHDRVEHGTHKILIFTCPSCSFFLFRYRKMRVLMRRSCCMKLNAGITTELLLTQFNVKGVLHYGIAGNANPNLQIGDVTIPQYWAHSGLWNWQVYFQLLIFFKHFSFESLFKCKVLYIYRT